MVFNDNLSVSEVTVAAGTSDANPVSQDLYLFDSVITELWIRCDATDVFARLTDNNSSLIPVTGYMHLPQGMFHAEFERKLQGPPYVLRIQAYNAGISDQDITFYIKTQEKTDVDTDNEILKSLDRILKVLERK